MYVPMLKTRREELSVLKEMNYCFSDDIIPLFEILTDRYEKRHKIDPKTNLYIYETKGKRRRRIIEPPTEDDIITLDYISAILKSKKAFIDYFRFSIEKYGRNIDVKRTDLALRLSRDSELYKGRIKKIPEYKNLIPVVSIKEGFVFKKKGLAEFLEELQENKDTIALRITEEYLDTYHEIIEKQLRKTDYLLFDIGEQKPKSKVMEFQELEELELDANIILLNSPRKAAINNGEYSGTGITDLIDNSARDLFAKHSFKGFGDYCGLKDTLPSNNGGNGTGAALALLYNYSENGFYSFLNPNTGEGLSGYFKVIKEILRKEALLDPTGICPAMRKINDLKSSGNWRTWHNITITRYINQLYENLTIN